MHAAIICTGVVCIPGALARFSLGRFRGVLFDVVPDDAGDQRQWQGFIERKFQIALGAGVLRRGRKQRRIVAHRRIKPDVLFEPREVHQHAV